jgi:hypothetical protein
VEERNQLVASHLTGLLGSEAEQATEEDAQGLQQRLEDLRVAYTSIRDSAVKQRDLSEGSIDLF